MHEQPEPLAEGQQRWLKLLTEGREPLRRAHRLFRHLPGPPRCKLCHNPFGGWGGKLVSVFGFYPSRKNPNLCARCCDMVPPGGAEVDIAVLFADVRGSTHLGEQLQPSAYAALLNRFYHAATEVLIRHDAIIDKLIGDEVMALFIRGICGPQYHQHAVEAAWALLQAVGYEGVDQPWIALGGAVNSGLAYVGSVGSEGVVDFTALGDTVNTASRMASGAAAGEMLLSQPVYATVASLFPDLQERTLTLRGKEAPIEVRSLTAGRPRSKS